MAAHVSHMIAVTSALLHVSTAPGMHSLTCRLGGGGCDLSLLWSQEP